MQGLEELAGHRRNGGEGKTLPVSQLIASACPVLNPSVARSSVGTVSEALTSFICCCLVGFFLFFCFDFS